MVFRSVCEGWLRQRPALRDSWGGSRLSGPWQSPRLWVQLLPTHQVTSAQFPHFEKWEQLHKLSFYGMQWCLWLAPLVVLGWESEGVTLLSSSGTTSVGQGSKSREDIGFKFSLVYIAVPASNNPPSFGLESQGEVHAISPHPDILLDYQLSVIFSLLTGLVTWARSPWVPSFCFHLLCVSPITDFQVNSNSCSQLFSRALFCFLENVY